MHKILLVSLSAALISVRLSGMAEAAYTERDVNRMEDLISSGNWVDLRIFLLANPRVMNGSDSFTQQLQKFLDETDSLYTALTFDSSLFPNVTAAVPTAPAPRVVRTTRSAQNSGSGENTTPSRSNESTSTGTRASNAQAQRRLRANAAQSIY